MKRLALALVVVLVLSFTTVALFLADSGGGSSSCWGLRCEELNQIRADNDQASLIQSERLQEVAELWAEEMAATGVLMHNPNLSTLVMRPYGENVGYGADWHQVFDAFMNSYGHRANMLDSEWTKVGVGAQRSEDRVWIVLVFRG